MENKWAVREVDPPDQLKLHNCGNLPASDHVVESKIKSTGTVSSDSESDVDHQDRIISDWGPDLLKDKGVEGILAEARALKLKPAYELGEVVAQIAKDSVDQDPFYVVDLSTVVQKLSHWKKLLHRVKPFYAYKCNNDDPSSKLLAAAGCGFDCASKAEIEAVLKMEVSPDRIVYANPCKQASMLRYARQQGVRKMTADNIEELHKIAEIYPEAEVLIRIAVDDSKSVCRFNSKFGAPEHEWKMLLSTCLQLGINVVGFSFHVGSGCGDLKPFEDAVASAKDAFELAKEYGYKPTILDCGGGFPGTDDGEFSFADVARVMSDALDHYFPPSSGVEIIAEPGRYMVSASHTYAVSIIAKRALTEFHLADTEEIESFGARPGKDSEIVADDGFKQGAKKSESNQPEVALYINDGCYGSFNCVVFDHAVVVPHVLPGSTASLAKTVPTKLFGPTCDSIDVVMPCTRLPELNVGDWIWFPDMGAYTRCASSNFNGQGAHAVHYVWSGMP